MLKDVSTFFGFLHNEKIIPANIAKEIKLTKVKKDEAQPAVLSISDVKCVFNSIPPKAKLYYALAAFAGIRPEELVSETKATVLDWSNINLDSKVITIQGDVSKIRKTRHISIAPNLLAFLKSIPKNKRVGRVIKHSNTTKRRIRKLVPIHLVKNVFRHSYASYGYYYYGIEAILDYLGHTDHTMLHKHYKGQSSKALANEYFNIKL